MPVTPVPHIKDHQKTPICQECFDRIAIVICKKCGRFLCADCRHTHKCEKKNKTIN